MYERLKQPLLTRRQFATRVVLHLLVAVGTAATALFAGVLGYHVLGRLSWIDSLLNASMILGGMGRSTRSRPAARSSSRRSTRSSPASSSSPCKVSCSRRSSIASCTRMHIDESGDGD